MRRSDGLVNVGPRRSKRLEQKNQNVLVLSSDEEGDENSSAAANVQNNRGNFVRNYPVNNLTAAAAWEKTCGLLTLTQGYSSEECQNAWELADGNVDFALDMLLASRAVGLRIST